MKLTDRVIFSVRADITERLDPTLLARKIRSLSESIEDCCTHGDDHTYPDWKNSYVIDYEYESLEYGGFRHGVILPDTLRKIEAFLDAYNHVEEFTIDTEVEFRQDACDLLAQILNEARQ